MFCQKIWNVNFIICLLPSSTCPYFQHQITLIYFALLSEFISFSHKNNCWLNVLCVFLSHLFFICWWERERGGERERNRNIDLLLCPSIHSRVDSYAHWPGMEPTTLVYQDDTVTHWAARPGLYSVDFIGLTRWKLAQMSAQ